MERTINTIRCLCGDFSMITLAEKLLLGAGAGTGAESKPYVEFVSSTAMTITPKYTNSGVTLQYSLDAESWNTIAAGATTPSANIIYFRGQATETKSLFVSNTTDSAWTFTDATNLECNGKLDRLIQDTLGSDDDVLTIGDYCFGYMFYNNAALITAPVLPATTLGTNCYNNMFYGCTNLTTAPALPATILANYCYNSMFYGCTNLTTAPALPATTLGTNCYQNMFNGCTSLTIAPVLPATTLASNCYNNMFRNCTSLTTAPELPTTILANYCYSNMFSGCTSLTTAPALPATTLGINCYNNMFYGCTNLTTAPALPATTLASNCYTSMFSGCTSLTTAPALPATTLASKCYTSMFSGCTKIKISTTITGIYDTAYRIPTSGIGTTAMNALSNMLTGTGGTFTGEPTINTTYYTENTPV